MSKEKVAAGEEVVEVAKKKGNALPLIVALVLFVAGGGFFMMKSKGGDAPKKHEAPSLGTIEPVKEILVNLAGGGSYLKAEISLHMVKDFKKEDLDKNMPAVSDAIILCLKSKRLADIQNAGQLSALKREIAGNVNAILTADSKEKDSKDARDAIPQKIPDGYDSADGPVLKVYFTSFATQ